MEDEEYEPVEESELPKSTLPVVPPGTAAPELALVRTKVDDIAEEMDNAALDAVKFLRKVIVNEDKQFKTEDRLSSARVLLSTGGSYVKNRKEEKEKDTGTSINITLDVVAYQPAKRITITPEAHGAGE